MSRLSSCGLNSRNGALGIIFSSVSRSGTAPPKSHEGRLKLISPLHPGTARKTQKTQRQQARKQFSTLNGKVNTKKSAAEKRGLFSIFRCTTFPLEFAALALISMTTAETALVYIPIVPSVTGD